jgi:hypothetical protein
MEVGKTETAVKTSGSTVTSCSKPKRENGHITVALCAGQLQRGRYGLQISTSVASGYVEDSQVEPADEGMLITALDRNSRNGSIFL